MDLALIDGTLSCHMAVSAEVHVVPGVWGHYSGAMLLGLSLNEGGQSAPRAPIDHLVTTHVAHPALIAESRSSGRSIYDHLNALPEDLVRGGTPVKADVRAASFPNFLGNGSPRVDPSLTGMIAGLIPADGPDELARPYVAAIQAVAYGTRHIIEMMNGAGYAIDFVLASGSGSRNSLFPMTHADALGIPLALGHEPEVVLLGAVILGAMAGGVYPGIPGAMAALTRASQVIGAAGGAVGQYHDARYAVSQRHYADHMACRELVEDTGRGVANCS